MKLEEKISKESRAIDPQKPVVFEPIVDVPLPSRRSSRVSQPPERYMGMLTEIGVMVMILISLTR